MMSGPVIKGVILLVGIVALLTYTGLGVQMANIVPASLTGFTTLSLSQAQFTSQNPYFAGNVWIMTVAQGGMGQSAYGSFPANDIGSRSGTYPERDFSLTIDYTEQSCNYDIVKETGVPKIFAVQLKEWSCVRAIYTDAVSFCGSSMIGFSKYPDPSLTCWCAENLLQTGAVAVNTIETPYVSTKSTITVNNELTSDSQSVDFNTAGNSKQPIGDNVYAVWNGDLIRGNCPNEDPYYAFYHQGNWKIGSRARYDAFRSATILLDSAISANSRSGLQAAVSTLNARASDALRVEPFAERIEGSTGLDGAVIEKTVPFAINTPLYTFFVKADWLGIYQPSPDIRVIGATCGRFSTNGEISATLKNFGETGNADVWVECSSPFSGTQTRSYGVTGNSQISVRLPISANVNQPTTRSCTVKANDGSGISEFAVSCTADPDTICTPGETRCGAGVNEDKIIRCNSFGTDYEVIESCSSNEYCTYDTWGAPYCESDGTNPPTCDIFCMLQKLATAFIAALVIALLLLVLLFVIPPTRKFVIAAWLPILLISTVLLLILFMPTVLSVASIIGIGGL